MRPLSPGIPGIAEVRGAPRRRGRGSRVAVVRCRHRMPGTRCTPGALPGTPPLPSRDPGISQDLPPISAAEHSCSGRFLDSRRLLGRSKEVQGSVRNSGIAPGFLIEWFLTEKVGCRPPCLLRIVPPKLSRTSSNLLQPSSTFFNLLDSTSYRFEGEVPLGPGRTP